MLDSAYSKHDAYTRSNKRFGYRVLDTSGVGIWNEMIQIKTTSTWLSHSWKEFERERESFILRQRDPGVGIWRSPLRAACRSVYGAQASGLFYLFIVQLIIQGISSVRSIGYYKNLWEDKLCPFFNHSLFLPVLCFFLKKKDQIIRHIAA